MRSLKLLVRPHFFMNKNERKKEEEAGGGGINRDESDCLVVFLLFQADTFPPLPPLPPGKGVTQKTIFLQPDFLQCNRSDAESGRACH